MDNMIQEIRSGNKEAVKAIYQEYAKDVYNFAKSITGDHDTALAATKKTFLVLFKNIQNGDEPSNLRTAALKLAYDEAYKMAAPKAQEAPVEEVAPQPQAPADPPFSQTVAPQELQDPAFSEPMFRSRGEAPAAVQEPVYEDEVQEEYIDTYEDEDDGFVPPANGRKRGDVYQPQGGYENLKVAAVPVDEEVYEEDIVYEEEAYDEPYDEPYEEPYEEERPSRRKGRGTAASAKKRKAAYEDEVDVYDVDEDEYDEDDYDDEEEKKPRNKGLFIFCIVLNIILILILLWFLGGLLVNLGILPDIDLGYSWFNSAIYPLF